jgi:hypothetical protein
MRKNGCCPANQDELEPGEALEIAYGRQHAQVFSIGEDDALLMSGGPVTQ